MSVRPIHFFLCSLCFHLGIFSLFGGNGLEYGLTYDAEAKTTAQPTLMARFVTDDAARKNSPRTNLLDRTMQESRTVEAKPRVSGGSAEFHLNEARPKEYSPVGHLTLVPRPLTEIDLNVAGINDSVVPGKIRLTLLIDSDGKVVDVAIEDMEMATWRVVAERVADRFRSARFYPGEINGTPVKSQLQITVVSEDLFDLNP